MEHIVDIKKLLTSTDELSLVCVKISLTLRVIAFKLSN